jgi:hypothetical protein
LFANEGNDFHTSGGGNDSSTAGGDIIDDQNVIFFHDKTKIEMFFAELL